MWKRLPSISGICQIVYFNWVHFLSVFWVTESNCFSFFTIMSFSKVRRLLLFCGKSWIFIKRMHVVLMKQKRVVYIWRSNNLSDIINYTWIFFLYGNLSRFFYHKLNLWNFCDKLTKGVSTMSSFDKVSTSNVR